MTVVEKNRGGRQVFTRAAAVASLSFAMSCVALSAQNGGPDDGFGRDRDTKLFPGNLVVSRSVYDNNPANVTKGEILPPNCAATTGGCGASTGAPNDGTYPFVWNNDLYDGSFGITSKIFLDQITPRGAWINSIEVPNSLEHGVTNKKDHLVTSFSSKSEIALHLSTDRKYLTFMGYVAPVNALDVSNSNTPDVVDSTNPVGQNFLRAVAKVDSKGHFTFTETNAYSGNNGRAAILNDTDGADFFYTAGNAGNGNNPQPAGVVVGAGAQLIDVVRKHEDEQDPGLPTPVGSFSVTQLGVGPDKIGKDDNYRGIAIFDNVLYYTKGSGSNGVNTVYFVDTTGNACPKTGIGVPQSGAALPTTSIPYDLATVASTGLTPNMCILSGFPSTLNKKAKVTAFPFALWFANANTLYIADEGDGYTGGTDLYTHAAAQTTAGLQKWTYDSATKSWSLAYTLQTGLNLGTPYTVHGYPTGTNAATKLPWAPAADGLRNITGRVNHDGTVTIWAITSTISGNGDTGADPNKLVVITDKLSNTKSTVAATEKFYTVREAGFAEVLRGVSFTPDSGHSEHGW